MNRLTSLIEIARKTRCQPAEHSLPNTHRKTHRTLTKTRKTSGLTPPNTPEKPEQPPITAQSSRWKKPTLQTNRVKKNPVSLI
uniref:Uncharacterized protein n=1 Tax=Leptobrachium leishanense TaxID=445787 RepID=A0A8C5M3V1_9ANUR